MPGVALHAVFGEFSRSTFPTHCSRQDLVEAAERALALVEALCTGEATATIESANVRPETVVGVQAALRSAYTRLRHNEKAGGSIAQQNR